MRPVRHIFIICVITVLLLTAAGPAAQSASRIYGYVSYGGVPASGATVTLAGPDSGQVNTTDSGYYEFAVSSGNYVVTASYGGHSASRTYVVSGAEARVDIDISTATPTPTPTPTPKPSHDPGGMVIRNESSSFIPMAPEFTVTPVPRPSATPTPTPTVAPTPTPTPTPSPGLMSNIYVWLAVALMAILIIAAVVLWYIRK